LVLVARKLQVRRQTMAATLFLVLSRLSAAALEITAAELVILAGPVAVADMALVALEQPELRAKEMTVAVAFLAALTPVVVAAAQVLLGRLRQTLQQRGTAA
jgi:hypothetical protein